MSDELWELVLVFPNDQVFAQALRVNSEAWAKDIANQWNRDRDIRRLKGRWIVSRLEGGIS